MNKKILFGSIVAVSVLIGVSFTSVVGYRSAASDVKASPLFNIRSSRAIDEDSVDLSCNYIGEEEENTLLIPKRENKALIQSYINRISKMDEDKFNRFIRIVINHLQNEKKLSKHNVDEIIGIFYLLRNDKNRQLNIDIFETNVVHSKIVGEPTIDPWFPFCFLILTLWSILFLIIFIIYKWKYQTAHISYCVC